MFKKNFKLIILSMIPQKSPLKNPNKKNENKELKLKNDLMWIKYLKLKNDEFCKNKDNIPIYSRFSLDYLL